MEKLIRREYIFYAPYPMTITFLGVQIVHVQYEYWYDGRLFLLGTLNDAKELTLIDAETGLLGIANFKGKRNVKNLVQNFKDNLKKTGFSVYELVARFKQKRKVMDLWEINLVM